MSDPAPIIARAQFILLDAWRDLSMAQRAALRLASASVGTRRVSSSTNMHTVRALLGKGLTGEGGDARALTPAGIHLRAVGLNADADAARRRFGRRRAATVEAGRP